MLTILVFTYWFRYWFGKLLLIHYINLYRLHKLTIPIDTRSRPSWYLEKVLWVLVPPLVTRFSHLTPYSYLILPYILDTIKMNINLWFSEKGGRLPVKFVLKDYVANVPENTPPGSVILTAGVNKIDPVSFV